MHKPKFIITTPRATPDELAALFGITPEERRQVDESLKPFLLKWRKQDLRRKSLAAAKKKIA